MLLNELKIIYSLFDYSGNWSLPYRENGYQVRQIDIKYGDDVRWLEVPKEPVYGILAAPPCTDFSSSGSQYWKTKDADGRTLASLELIGAMSRFILATNPHFWVVENPIGRLKKWFGEPKMYFQPYWYGDAYTKMTALWGKFKRPKVKIANYVEPVKAINGHHSMDKYLGITCSFEKRKELRSITPLGFAWAFYEANR